MALLFIADPLASFKIHKDSTFAMMLEADRRGHALWACEARELAWRDGRVGARAARVRLTGRTPDWFVCEPPQWQTLDTFAAVLLRKDPPFDQDYLYATWLLDVAERDGARIFNRPRAVRDHNEKLAIARFAEFIAPTVVSADPAHLRAFLAEQGEIVVKPLDAMGGAGVFRVRGGDPNVNVIFEVSTHNGRRAVMAQRFLPEIAAGDTRILLIDGVPVPYGLARLPAPGESRGNLAAGGRGEARPLSAREQEIVAALGPRLAAEGLFLVGLDVIGEFLTEINVTSPTCFREIAAQTGYDVAAHFMDALEKRLQAPG